MGIYPATRGKACDQQRAGEEGGVGEPSVGPHGADNSLCLLVRTLGQRVAANTTYQLAWKAAVLAIAAVSIAVLTRYLGPADYGRYALALSFMQLFGVLADAGLTTIVVRELSSDRARADELMANALLLRLLLALATIVVAGLV